MMNRGGGENRGIDCIQYEMLAILWSEVKDIRITRFILQPN